ncbi:CAP domain-containing protein [Streptomyces purpureus]|uniref:CAP domain-containing protein n=1 Tax=Streptomyces purpureus TaxID=1951 RepID=UPI00035C38D0|nr:CAP domain-containing protein [Streptomyces purpureus]
MATGAVALVVVAGGAYGVSQFPKGGGGEARTVAEAPADPAAPAVTSAAPADPDRATVSAAPSASASASAAPSASASESATKRATASKASPSTGKEARTKPAAKPKTTPATGSGRATQRPTAKPARPGGGHAGLAQQIVDMVNAERAKSGCGPVTANSKLTKAAQRHSDDMAARDYYAHSTPEGVGPGERITAAGYRWSTYGENIFKSPKDARTAMAGWMKSPGHRDNILNCSFKEIGVGINLRSNGPWWTQNFAAR